MQIRLQRQVEAATHYYGQIVVGGDIVVPATLEHVGILPYGTYHWKKVVSPKRGLLVIELTDVPGHTNIQFHVGNTLEDSEGCVLVGSQRSARDVAILNSCPAYLKLMKAVKDAETGELVVEKIS